MKTIWKFAAKIDDRQDIRVPKGTQVLTAQMQGQELCLWAMVEMDAATIGVDMPVWVHGTGHPADVAATFGRYLASVQMMGGTLVFHVFVGKDF